MRLRNAIFKILAYFSQYLSRVNAFTDLNDHRLRQAPHHNKTRRAQIFQDHEPEEHGQVPQHLLTNDVKIPTAEYGKDQNIISHTIEHQGEFTGVVSKGRRRDSRILWDY